MGFRTLHSGPIRGQYPPEASRCHAVVLEPVLSCPAARVSSATSSSFITLFNALCKHTLIHWERHISHVYSAYLQAVLCLPEVIIVVKLVVSLCKVWRYYMFTRRINITAVHKLAYFNMVGCVCCSQATDWVHNYFNPNVRGQRAAVVTVVTRSETDTPVAVCLSNPTREHTHNISIPPMTTAMQMSAWLALSRTVLMWSCQIYLSVAAQWSNR